MARKVMAGKALSGRLVSCMHSTSGCTEASHSSTRGRRALSEFTFQVAMRNIRPDPIWPHRPPDSVRSMQAVMWFDYVCPWAYLGRDRTTVMRSLGVDVVVRPFELHPEIPREGV